MDISTFFDTYLGMYITQSFCHSTVAFIIVERTLYVWKITDPVIRQRFRIFIVLSAVFSMPLYQLLNPDRGSIAFRQSSLFDSKRWLYLELPGPIPLGMIFIAILFMTTLIFLFQELIPILRHTIESKAPPEIERDFKNTTLEKALEGLKNDLPDIKIVSDRDLILYSVTGGKTAVYISQGMIESLSPEQLRSVVAHEIAHIKRNKIPLLTIIYLLRIAMFFNPIVLVEFRRITHEEEKICDDIAVSLTGDPEALSGALEKLYGNGKKRITREDIKRITNLKETIEEYSQSYQIESRVRRLKKGVDKAEEGQWAIFILASSIITVINYFVV